MKEYGWRSYGQKHHESRFTKFFQNHYLPKKFGFDKRKAHLSSLISSGQLTRKNAIKEFNKPLYDLNDLDLDREYFIKKLDLTQNKYDEVMNMKPNFYYDYKSYHKLYNFLRKNSKWFTYIKKSLNKM